MSNDSDASRNVWLRCDVGTLSTSQDMTALVTETLLRKMEELEGTAAANHIRKLGVERIHEVLDLKKIAPLRDGVLEELRVQLLELAVKVGREVLNWRDDFYVDDYLILRINYPYESARKADPSAENPGIGRLSARVREIAQSRRVIDPVYNPKAYHRGHPPAAWAHGPHLDSWAGHSKDGRNLWWAISPVPPEAGMVLYPELAGVRPPVDPTSLYLKRGYKLPVPTYLPLKPGEMLVFDPEVLHGTHLNTSNGTRVAVSMRLNASKPTFDPGCFYAREFWRHASDIEAGVDRVLHLKREENLGNSHRSEDEGSLHHMPELVGIDSDEYIEAELPKGYGESLFLIRTPRTSVLVKRDGDAFAAFDNHCPHYHVELSDGGASGNSIYCPACAVRFDLTSGQSDAGLFTLRKRSVHLSEDRRAIRVRIDN